MNTISEEMPIKYFAMIPHIIYELDLDPYERDLYCLLKRITCENSTCTYSNENLAKMLKISLSKLKKIKKRLCEVFPIINLPLIICNSRSSKEKGSQTNEIKIVNIWPQSTAYFEEKKEKKKQVKLEENDQKSINRGFNSTPLRGFINAPKKKHVFKNIKEINKEKKSTELSQGKGLEDVSGCEDNEVKSAIFPFSFSKQEMGEIFEKVKDICHDKLKFVKVLEYAEVSKFWNRLIKSPEQAIKHFNSIYEQAKSGLERAELIAKRKAFAQTQQFESTQSYSIADDKGYHVISGSLTYTYKYHADNDYWSKFGLGETDGN